MAQWVIACTALAQDWSSVPGTCTGWVSEPGEECLCAHAHKPLTLFFKILLFTSSSWWVFVSLLMLVSEFPQLLKQTFSMVSMWGSILENVLDALGKNAYSTVLGYI